MLAIVVGAAVVLAAGGLLGYWMASRTPERDPAAVADAPPDANITWTCSMHPQVQMPEPGQCPICYMDLIPMEDDGAGLGPRQLRMTEGAIALADIQVTPVRRQFVTKPVRMVGKVDYDETRLANITARVPGRLDRLFVDYTGVTVREGDHLVKIYSPELIVAQQELLLAHRAAERDGGATGPGLRARSVQLAEEKLRLLGVLEHQIEAIKERGTPSDHLTIYAPIGGVVVERHATEGMYVETGTNIYTIADLSQVWVFMDAYESDVPWLRFGQEVEFTTESFPGEVFHGRVAFIDPVLKEKTRTVRVRVNVPNPERKLKPGMFVRALARSRLAKGGKVFDASLAGKWISPMHPEIVKDGPGQCDICGMDLVPAEELGFIAPEKPEEAPLVIPATAPLVTGQRAVVYVRLPVEHELVFEGREVVLGPRAGGYYLVRHGLEEGELVVTRGNFKIDSALQIQAKPSMMSIEADVPLVVPDDFRQQLAPLYDHYLELQVALADDRADDAQEHWQALQATMDELPESAVDRRLDETWSAVRKELAALLAAGADLEAIGPMRTQFEPLAEAMLDMAQTFGHPREQPLYEAHCPMAFGNRGASWLQAGETIANPYFGHAMLRCGDVVRPFPPGAPSGGPSRSPDGTRPAPPLHDHE